MNEVTKIHLGRQAFTISVDAHHDLKNYLEAINKQVSDKDVAQEIELRMAELLSERGVTTDKVILPSDVDFLKTQLGNPKDFKDDENETQASNIKQGDSKHIFRDTDNAMVAGVAAGLAQYFGVGTLLVRILFIIFVVITAGWGILLYVVLWLLVPEAKTSSDRLRMAGKPVNVDSLKEIVEQADVKGTVHRANSSLANFINSLFRCVLKLAGIVFMLLGLSAIFGLVAAETYLLVDGKTWAQNNIFPVGFREHLLLDIVMLVVALIASFVIIFGIAMFRRKWPIRSWVTGLLVGLILVGLAIGGALTGDVYPNVRDRYNANVHSSIRTFTPFNTLYINGPENVNFQIASTYYIDISYYGHPNLSEIKTSVVGKALTIDDSQFNLTRNCQSICIPNNYNLNVTIYAPDANQLANQAGYGAPWPPAPLNEP